MKRKLLAGLMATGLALSVSTATINNNEDNSSFNISNNTTLYQSKLQKKDLSHISDNYNKAFNNMIFNFDLCNEVFGSDFWCGFIGSDMPDEDTFKSNFNYDIPLLYRTYLTVRGETKGQYMYRKLVKNIYDTDGNVFAVVVWDYTSNDLDFKEFSGERWEFDTQYYEKIYKVEDRTWNEDLHVNGFWPLTFNLYISDFAGKNKKFEESEIQEYLDLDKKGDLSFNTLALVGYDKYQQFQNIDVTNDDFDFYINPEIQSVIELDKTISLSTDIGMGNLAEPIYFGLSVGYESADKDYPTIDGNATYYFNVDTAKSFDYIKSTITAYDETEGDITNKIQFTNTDNYSLDNLELKTYNFTASVSDESGHTATQDFQIVIKDVTAPTISSMNKEVSYASKLTQEEIKNLFTYSDNYNITNDLIFEIVSDNYTNSYNEIGEHQITARVTDKSGNYNEATATVDVVDKIAPIFACATSYEISTISSKNLTLDKLVFSLRITANDVIDGPIVVSLEDLDNYSKNLGKAGSYTIRAIASDSHNNTATTEFELNVVDNDYPVISVNSPYCIIVQEGELITESIIKNILIASGQISEDEAKTLHIESSVLRMNSISAGSYDLKLKFDSGRENTIILNVNESLKENANVTNFGNTLKEQFSSAVDNIANISQWNWMNWTMLVLGMFFIILIVLGIKKIIRK